MITQEQAIEATARMGSLKFFPSDEAARGEIVFLLRRMVDTPDKLSWLLRTMVDRVGQWHGPAELRGVYCTKFKPADGIEANCLLTSGFTASDSEAEHAFQIADARYLELSAPRESQGLKQIKGPVILKT